MKVNNWTNWDTKTLEDIFTKCMLEVRKHEGKKWNLNPKTFTVKVYNTKRQGHVAGSAYLNSDKCRIGLPVYRDGVEIKIFGRHNNKWHSNEYAVADLFLHELGHCLGVEHTYKTLATIEHTYVDFLDANFSDTKRIPKEVVVKKPKPDIKMVRYQRAKKNLENALAKLKRSKNLYKKWSQKVSYYERSFAMAAKNPPKNIPK